MVNLRILKLDLPEFDPSMCEYYFYNLPALIAQWISLYLPSVAWVQIPST